MNYSSARHVDAPAGDERRSYAGLTEAATYSERTRDRVQSAEASRPEALRPKSPEQIAGEAGLAMRERWAAEARAAEQEKSRRRTERAAVDALKKTLVDECGFTPDTAEASARELRRK